VRDAVVAARDDFGASEDKRLVAYVATVADYSPTTVNDSSSVVASLRAHLRQRLPEHMLPAHFVLVESFPLSPSGKVDRKRLPPPEAGPPAPQCAPTALRTPAEQTLAEIWSQVLGLSDIGVRDNFFELGGDSILSLQVIARAARAGLRLTPRQFFQQPTIEAQAAAAAYSPLIHAEQGPVTGPVPLTPIQRWFFDHDWPQPAHWNQAFLLEVHEPLDPDALRGAAAALLQQHDALRLRFTRAAGGWLSEFAPPVAHTLVEVIDLTAESNEALAAAIETRCVAEQASLSLSAGPLMRVAYFDCGPKRPGRLLLVIHHLAVDGVSWRVLFEDLQVAYTQLRAGRAVALPPKTTSFQAWAQRLIAEAGSEATLAELTHWQSQGAPPPLPVDHRLGPNDEASAESVPITFTEEETQTLLRDVPSTYGADLNGALLTALTQALRAWTGSDSVWLTLEGHGREALCDDVDVTRTVGWFTSFYPVRLELSSAQAADPGSALRVIKEQLRRTPRRGLGYGLLRFVSGLLPEASLPAISFNYLGQFDQALSTATGFTLARESPGPSRNPAGQRVDVLSIVGSLAHGRLNLEWSYSRNLHRRETIDRLAHCFAQALRTLLAHCRALDQAAYTPSDFPEAGLSLAELGALMEELSQG
jgi:non-ribosomal peptide synthase protein (TIGR01720 family)